MPGQEKFNVRIQEEGFDVAALQSALLRCDADEGAVVAFTGYVRSSNGQRKVDALELEHYPGMTEKSIQDILEKARDRWPLLDVSVVHRVGNLIPGDQIVWVGVSSAHREAAYSACEFIMDYLKTRAPFWKKERGPAGEHWVDSRPIDAQRAQRWQK